MQDLIGSVRRSFVFRTSTSTAANNENDAGRFGGFAEKLGSTIRSSRIGLFTKSPSPPLKQLLPPPPSSVSKKGDAVPIQWSKGECIGAGAFGRVYIGMNFDSGGFIAIKQVSIAANSASREKTQAHIRELEEEVNLLKNLSHPNIVRYLGTAREETSLNILLEFVPGGSISSVLGKFGSFPERVIKMYTKQLLLGLEYLHKNGIMHRDIKGANILVDNDGCIKLADFGASKKVVELATITGAKSMKGTPYWMAPEVILQTGHSFSADIWSVGCTIIEMATGKPPWSQQYQEVAALFHIGTTKSHPPIPEHLSVEARDFLLRCLQKEPNLRPSASDLLQHPFLTGEHMENHPLFHTSLRENPENSASTSQMDFKSSMNPNIRESCNGLKSFCGMGSVGCSTVYPDNYSGGRYFRGSSNCDDEMCIIDDQDDFSTGTSTKMNLDCLFSTNINKSFNPMYEPPDDWPCKFGTSLELDRSGGNLSSAFDKAAGSPDIDKGENEFSFPCGPVAAEEDDEVRETKIKAFLDEKALDLKKLQTPLYKEFYKTVNAACPPCAIENADSENSAKFLKMLPPKFKSPNKSQIRRFSSALRASSILSPGKLTKCPSSNANGTSDRTLREIQSPPQPGGWKDSLLIQQETISPRSTFSDRQRKWKEELDEELERTRVMMRQAGVGSKTASPKYPKVNR